MMFDAETERIQARRRELQAEQKRLVAAFTKGYLPEHELDREVDRIRTELRPLPPPQMKTADEMTDAAIVAGKTLSDMASYWDEAMPEVRRDIVWAHLGLGGLVYDLERQAIIGLLPRKDVMLILAMGLSNTWEQRTDGLWLRQASLPQDAA